MPQWRYCNKTQMGYSHRYVRSISQMPYLLFTLHHLM